MDAKHQEMLEGIKQRRRLRGATDTPYTPYPVSAESVPALSPKTADQPQQRLRSPIASQQTDSTPTVPEAAAAAAKHASNYVLGVYTKNNPFRPQTYFDFLVNPNHSSRQPSPPTRGQPLQRGSVIFEGDSQTNTKPMDPLANLHQPPAFNLETCLQVLKAGDWFLKWNRRKSHVTRRYMKLCRNAQSLVWSRAENGNSILNASVALMEIVHMEGFVLLWDERPEHSIGAPRRSVPVYCMKLYTSRFYELQIGTELRDKYDLWFDCLMRLTQGKRDQTRSRLEGRPWLDKKDPRGFAQATDPTE